MSQPTNEFPTQPTQPGVPGQPGPDGAPAQPPAYAPPVAPAAKKSKAGPIFGTLAVLFLLAAGGMGALYVMNKSASDKTIADQKAQIATLQADATKKDGELASAKSDLTTAKADLDKAKACNTAVTAFFDAVKKQDNAASEAAVLPMAVACGINIL